jgi:hypothetical protein
MQQLSDRRPFFEGIGLLIAATDEYAEDPPHPSLEDAKRLLEKLT